MTGPLAVRERPERAVKPGTRGTPCSTSAAQWTSKMKNDAADKSFDVMKWLRATRAELYVETKIMSIDERREWESRRIPSFRDGSTGRWATTPSSRGSRS